MKKVLGICRKTEIQTDYYDLHEDVTRNKLADMNFVLVVRDKP